jgi:hypothetical protein
MDDPLMNLRPDGPDPDPEPEVNEYTKLFHDGGCLRSIHQTEGWEVVVEIMDMLRDKAIDDLTNMLPGNPEIPQAHACASGFKQMHREFFRAVDSRLNAPNPNSPRPARSYNVLPE